MEKSAKDRETAARQLLDQGRKQLLGDAPELLPAIYLMKAEPVEEPGPLRADGLTLYYHPETVIRDYLAEKKSIPRQLLHILCHGLLGHFQRRKGQMADLFDAAADLSANALALELDPKFARKPDRETREKYLGNVDTLYLAARTKAEAQALTDHARPFREDDHSLWDDPPSGKNGAQSDAMARIRQLWQNTVCQVAEGMSRNGRGDTAGTLSELFRETDSSPISYTELLRRFCALRELAHADPDSINRIWYHVGLDLTGDTPILEPDELREDRTLEHIAVALDTSGSCSGEVMEGFLRELLAVLRDGGGPKVEFTLIQCDEEIQKVETLSGEDMAERLSRGIRLLGWGGTDFRPVFDYVKEQREREDGVKFAGLLYLTDGWGQYPREKPDYPVVFLFPRGEEAWDEDIGCICPDWITKVFIQNDGSLRIDEKA